MSTALPSESILSMDNNNHLFSFNGGFTPWENFESFFTFNEQKPTLTSENKHITHIKPNSKPELRHYYACMNLGSASSNKKSPCFSLSNLSSYHAGSNLGLEDLNNPMLPCLDEPDLGSKSLNLDCHHASSNLGLDSNPDQKLPCFDKTSLDDDQLSPDSVLSFSGSGFDDPDQNQKYLNSIFCAYVEPNSNSVLLISSSGSDDPNQNQNGSNLNLCPDEPVNNMDERKRIKRMISNRASARRSRMRKQRHVENLRNNVNQLNIQTRERSNQLRLMNHRIQLVRRENDRFKAESIILQRKLIQLSQIWQLQQLQQRSYHHPPSTPSCTAVQRII